MRRRLLVVTVASAALVAIAFAVPLGVLVRNVARDRAISAAEGDAAALAPALAVTDDPGTLESAIARTETGDERRLTIVRPDGSTLGAGTADPEVVELVRRDQVSLSVEVAEGVDLYTPVVTADGAVSIITARVPDAALTRGVARAWLALGSVAVVLIAASAAVADRLARSMIADAHDLSSTARALAGGDPAARASGSEIGEIDDAANALNRLADRIDELRAAERERVADLSHRLRTPLTALRLDAESAGFAPIVDHVDRLEAAVTDLIRSARRPLHDAPTTATCDPVVVTGDRARFWSALAQDDRREWSLDADEGGGLLVACPETELAEALDALLGNVFTHTPAGTPYRVSVGVDDHEVTIVVADEGPGITTPDAVRRGATTGPRSTGLGLDIARRCATDAGGRLEIDDSPGPGTSVRLVLPAR